MLCIVVYPLFCIGNDMDSHSHISKGQNRRQFRWAGTVARKIIIEDNNLIEEIKPLSKHICVSSFDGSTRFTKESLAREDHRK